jgi:hypothetical protein
MSTTTMDEILHALKQPFHPKAVSWKPGSISKDGASALALPYADLRVYQNRLDEVCGMNWSVTYTPWGERVICHLTINGITRSSTGEADSQQERSAPSGLPAGTAAEAQAFKRACSMFGLGRYLYALPVTWVDYDAQARQFTAQAQARLEGVVVQHYQRTTAQPPTPEVTSAPTEEAAANEQLVQLWQQFDALGSELYGDRWGEVSRHNTARLTEGATDNPETLTAAQLQTLITGMEQLKRKPKPARTSKRVAKAVT